jgi:hypothetical protein
MIVGRILGWLLLLAALAAAGYEAMAAFNAGAWRPVAMGELWYKLHATSLNAAQAGIQRHIAPWLWEPGITTILRLPGWAVLGVPGLLMLWGFRRRTRHADRRFG